MSFGINGPRKLPTIQEAQNMMNNGGGGNLGYFQRGKRKKKYEEKEENDIIELSSSSKDEEEKEELKLDNIGSRIKNFWLTMHSKNNEKNPEDE